MAGERDNHGPTMTLTDAVNEIRRLQAKVTAMDKEKADKEDNHDEDEINDSQPLAQALWDARVSENFKTPHLPTFDGKTDPSEHFGSGNTNRHHRRCRSLEMQTTFRNSKGSSTKVVYELTQKFHRKLVRFPTQVHSAVFRLKAHQGDNH
ncbi:hypothetical protein QL285_033674 [Trifolium repens]|nr:hypothetical protein QL285_033674 [Trifolium repens]